jgi:hypothetical protein
MMQNPDKQKHYRDKLIKQIKSVPQLDPSKFLADELQESCIESVADKSDPTQMRRLLASFFKRR